MGSSSRWRRWKLGLFLFLLIASVLALVLYLALKPEPVDIEHSFVSLIHANSTSNSSPISLQMLLVVSNPNLAGRFFYSDANTYVFNKGVNIGESSISRGQIPARSSHNISGFVRVNSSSAAGFLNSSISSSASTVSLASEINVTGVVKTLGTIKRQFTLSSSCNLNISVQNESLLHYECFQHRI